MAGARKRTKTQRRRRPGTGCIREFRHRPGALYGRFTDPVTRKQKTLKLVEFADYPTENKAWIAAEEELQDAIREARALDPKHGVPRELTLREFVAGAAPLDERHSYDGEYVTLSEARVGGRHLQDIKSKLGRAARFFGDRPMSEIGRPEAQDYVAALARQPGRKWTIVVGHDEDGSEVTEVALLFPFPARASGVEGLRFRPARPWGRGRFVEQPPQPALQRGWEGGRGCRRAHRGRAVSQRLDRVTLCGRSRLRAWAKAGLARPIPLRALGVRIEALSRTSFRPAVASNDILPHPPADPRVAAALVALPHVRVGRFDDWAVVVGVSTSTLRNVVRAEYGLSLMDVWYLYVLALRATAKGEGVTVRQLSPDLGYANETACYRTLRVAKEQFGAEIL